MNTFLPYPSFEESAKCLDYRRLGKQRVEAWQIYQTLIGKSKGWQNHPAVNMWRGYERALLKYGLCICDEWIKRDYKDSLGYEFLKEFLNKFFEDSKNPIWLGDEKFHAAMRSNLLRKDPVWYGKFGWQEPPDLPYIWPTKESEYAEGRTKD